MKLSICKPLDKLLDGGLESGCITNFYGPPGSGKSNIAFSAAYSCISQGKKIIYIDTEGGFSVERINQLSQGKNILDKIILIEPKTWKEQQKEIRKIEAIIKKEQIGLIIVDSIVALWRLEIDKENAAETNKELATQLSLLSKIAREKVIPILITNQIYSDIETGKIEISSKTTVKWWSKNLIELIHSGRSGYRIAIVRKARSIPEDKQVEFQIAQDGIKEASKLRLF